MNLIRYKVDLVCDKVLTPGPIHFLYFASPAGVEKIKELLVDVKQVITGLDLKPKAVP